MTRQEMAYLDAEVELLRKHKEEHDCGKCGGKWCIEHSSQQARIRYSQLYGCICGTCCRLCKDAAECGFDGEIKCIDCDILCGVNPKQ